MNNFKPKKEISKRAWYAILGGTVVVMAVATVLIVLGLLFL